MGAGALNVRLELLRASVSTDAAGGEVKTWAPIATVWAERMQAGVGERIAGGQTQASVTCLFRIRWAAAWANLDPTDRVRERDSRRTYDVRGVVDPNQVRGQAVRPRTWLEITAAARAERVA